MFRFILWCLITGGIVVGCFFGFGRIDETVNRHYVYKSTTIVVSEKHLNELEKGIVKTGTTIKTFDYTDSFPSILQYNLNSKAVLPQFGQGKIDYAVRNVLTGYIGFFAGLILGIQLPNFQIRKK